ncbi:MAG: hypothetical protein R3C68_03685 [Myxococcota bacterium]
MALGALRIALMTHRRRQSSTQTHTVFVAGQTFDGATLACGADGLRRPIKSAVSRMCGDRRGFGGIYG